MTSTRSRSTSEWRIHDIVKNAIKKLEAENRLATKLSGSKKKETFRRQPAATSAGSEKSSATGEWTEVPAGDSDDEEELAAKAAEAAGKAHDPKGKTDRSHRKRNTQEELSS